MRIVRIRESGCRDSRFVQFVDERAGTRLLFDADCRVRAAEVVRRVPPVEARHGVGPSVQRQAPELVAVEKGEACGSRLRVGAWRRKVGAEARLLPAIANPNQDTA